MIKIYITLIASLLPYLACSYIMSCFFTDMSSYSHSITLLQDIRLLLKEWRQGSASDIVISDINLKDEARLLENLHRYNLTFEGGPWLHLINTKVLQRLYAVLRTLEYSNSKPDDMSIIIFELGNFDIGDFSLFLNEVDHDIVSTKPNYYQLALNQKTKNILKIIKSRDLGLEQIYLWQWNDFLSLKEISNIDISTTTVSIPVKEVLAHSETVDGQENRIVYVGLSLPLKYSILERVQNLNRMKSDVPNFEIVEGYHTNNISALNTLLKYCAENDLYITPHYFNDKMLNINIGKPSIIASFFKVFHLIETSKKWKTFDCLVIIEDDFQLDYQHTTDSKVLERTCNDLRFNKITKYWVRFERYNTINMYNIRKLHQIKQHFQNTTIELPFDDYSYKYGFFARRLHKLQSKWKKMKSTLLSQHYVRIRDWNDCLNKLKKQKTIELSDNKQLCDFKYFNDNQMISKPKNSKIKPPY